MKLFGRIIETIKEYRAAKRIEQVAKILTDNPLSMELIRQIAKDYGYHFEIVQKDGSRMLFHKEGYEAPASGDQWRDW